MRIGIDIDGVLADFNTGFIERAIAVTGKDLFPARPFDIPEWNYPEHYGYSDAEISAIWENIAADSTFWLKLPPYPNAMGVLERLRVLTDMGHDIYFITSRPGVVSKRQSEIWLGTHGGDFLQTPTVLISGKKGASASALDLHAYIDDRYENVVDVSRERWVKTDENPVGASKTLVFLVNQPWNTGRAHWDAILKTLSVWRVSSVDEMLNQVGL